MHIPEVFIGYIQCCPAPCVEHGATHDQALAVSASIRSAPLPVGIQEGSSRNPDFVT